MNFRHIFQLYHNFSKLSKPNLSKYPSLFQLMRDRTTQLQSINTYNQSKSNTTKTTTLSTQIQKNLHLSQQLVSQLIKNNTIRIKSYSPILMNPYKISQQLNGKIKIQDDIQNIEGLYKPGYLNLKYHYSINKEIPLISQHKLTKQTMYLFHLPKNLTETEIYKQLDFKCIKNIQIQYCMLGLPAFAVIQMKSDKFAKEKLYIDQFIASLTNKNYLIVTEKQSYKLPLHRRQIVIKGISQDQTPASMLQILSSYGRVLHLNLPMETYKNQSLKQIKQLYKNQKIPIKINYHKIDGTIESEYYPPFQPINVKTSVLSQKQQQYHRRLRYCQNIDIYQGKEGTIETKSKGFCIVTFSCQEQAQNCYYHLRNFIRMDVLNGKQQFQFDQKHYEALLRFIDNSYIQQCKSNKPYKSFANLKKKQRTKTFQSLYLRIVYEKMQKNCYKPLKQPFSSDLNKKILSHQQQQIKLYRNYQIYLNRLKDSIGMANFNQSLEQQLNFNQSNKYGKSFDELAEQQLFAMKLKQNINKQRYEVNIDDYFYQQKQPKLYVKKRYPKQPFLKKPLEFFSYKDHHKLTPEMIKQRVRNVHSKVKRIMKYTEIGVRVNTSVGKFSRRKVIMKKRMKEENKSYQGGKQYNTKQQHVEGEQEVQSANKNTGKQQQQTEQTDQTTTKIKNNFSTQRELKKQYRAKTLQEKVQSHMKYNKFVRNVINQYMGIFPMDKLQSQFNKTKPNFINPQSLKFINGDDFLPEDQLPHILQYTTQQPQEQYNQFIIQNEISKSLNIDVEEMILKNMGENISKTLHYYSEIGAIKQEFLFKGKNIEQTLNQLNMEANSGEGYKIVTAENGTKSIAKINKIQHIFPLELTTKFKKIFQYLQQKIIEDINQIRTKQKKKKQSSNTSKTQKSSPDPSNQKQKLTNLIEDICTKFSITKKDLQKLMNLRNYTQQQIQNDIQQQLSISKIKNKLAPKKPSDYSRNVSDIKIRGRNNKAIVSKFRQI